MASEGNDMSWGFIAIGKQYVAQERLPGIDWHGTYPPVFKFTSDSFAHPRDFKHFGRPLTDDEARAGVVAPFV